MTEGVVGVVVHWWISARPCSVHYAQPREREGRAPRDAPLWFRVGARAGARAWPSGGGSDRPTTSVTSQSARALAP